MPAPPKTPVVCPVRALALLLGRLWQPYCRPVGRDPWGGGARQDRYSGRWARVAESRLSGATRRWNGTWMRLTTSTCSPCFYLTYRFGRRSTVLNLNPERLQRAAKGPGQT